ncbi:hypothetical protein FG379_001873 [Cryptosporidium bovis]|uniref:uncharacterized protein n=1 Tax=Cryptosporidium bovis TaxID=310047 RepID=UPI00351A1B6F|nr:hypothetical protein FG379_001873 [Cryptosporidium bovis]
MSSLKHSVHRRVHLERATPAKRLRFGILERKKDYKLRAIRYHEKENLFKSLSEKARTRNPDEFDFKMVNSRMENGRYTKITGGKEGKFSSQSLSSMNSAERKLAESQNMTYVNYRRSIDESKIKRMKKELTLFGENFERNHTFFSDDDSEEKGKYKSNNIDEYLSNGIIKNLTKSYRIMNDIKARADSLRKVSNHLELQKNMQSSERKRKIINSDGKTEIIWHPKHKHIHKHKGGLKILNACYYERDLMMPVPVFHKRLLLKYFLLTIVFCFVTKPHNVCGTRSSPKKDSKQMKPVRPVKRTPQQYVLSGAPNSPGSYFKHLQTTVLQDSSSSSESSKSREATPPMADSDKSSGEKKTRTRYRYVHHPVGYEKKSDSCKAELDELKSQIESLNQELKLKDEKIKMLESRLQAEKEESYSAQKLKKSELRRKEKKITQKEDELNARENRMTEKELSLRTKEEALRKKEIEISRRITELQEKEGLMSKNVDEYQTKLMELQRKENDILQSNRKNADKEAVLKHETQLLNEKKKELSELETKLNDLSSLNTINSELRSKILSLNSEINQVMKGKDELLKELTMAQSENSSKEKTISDLRAELETTKRLLNDCLEEKNELLQFNEPKKRLERPKEGDHHDPYKNVIKELKERHKEKIWVQATQRKTPQKEPKPEPDEELKLVFDELGKLKRQEFEDFVKQNNLEDASLDEQLEKFEEHKNQGSPGGNFKIPRFVQKESET